MHKNSLCSMNDLSIEEINNILHDARLFNSSYSDWQLPLKKCLVANLFFEPSTRTHYSFASAQHQLGCRVVDFTAETSSVTKGETFFDTVKTFEMVGYDVLVIRHPQTEYFKELEGINVPILNAGDGAGNHPTQCLLDLLTMQNEFGTLKGLKIAIVGDILHSRVAASNKWTLEKMGNEVVFCGPEEWERPGYPTMNLDEAVEWCDVLMMLRIQRERGATMAALTKEQYLERYGLTKERYSRLQKHAIVMHPAPFNRDVEIASELVEAPKSRIFEQMANGVLVRKAVLKRAFGFEPF